MELAMPMVSPRPLTPTGGRRLQFTGGLREDALYIERAADRELYERLLRGEFCHVLAPRQMGKSSIRTRVAQRLKEEGICCASIDLTAIGVGSSNEQWYFGLMSLVAARLRLDEPDEFWEAQGHLAPVDRWTRYLRKVVLAEIDRPVVLFLDEIEVVQLVEGRMDDFFLSLRGLYEARADEASCRRLTFCLMGATDPSELITDKRVTPFNISHPVSLEDFTRAELDALAPTLAPLGANTDRLIDEIHQWTDGHPYMTIRLAAAVAEFGDYAALSAGGGVNEVVQKVFIDIPLDDPNLSYALRRFNQGYPGVSDTEKIAIYRQLLAGVVIAADADSLAQTELRLCGMVKNVRVGGRAELHLRNRAFAHVFDREWLRSKEQQRFLSEALWQWVDSGKSRRSLLLGEALSRAEMWARSVPLTPSEEEFLRESLAEERRETSRRRWVTRVLIGLLSGLVLAAGTTLWQFRDRVQLGLSLRETQSSLEKTQRTLNETAKKLTTTEISLTQTQTKLTETEVALAQTRTKLTETEAALTQTQTKLTEAEVALVQTRTKLTETEVALAQDRTKLTETEVSLTQTRIERDNAKSTLERIEPELKQVKGELEATKEAFVRAQKELLDTRATLTQSQANLASTRATLAQTQTELTNARTVLPQAQTDLADTRATLTQKENELKDNKAALVKTQGQLLDTQKELAQARAELAKLRAQLEEIQKHHSTGGSPDAANGTDGSHSSSSRTSPAPGAAAPPPVSQANGNEGSPGSPDPAEPHDPAAPPIAGSPTQPSDTPPPAPPPSSAAGDGATPAPSTSQPQGDAAPSTHPSGSPKE